MRIHTALLAAGLSVSAFTTSVQAQDAAQWVGFYAGAAINTTSLEMSGAAPFPVGLGTESNFGFFGGYNHAVGSNFVVGGELAYFFESTYTPVFLFPSLTVDNTAVLRGRAGYATGNVLAYATLGYAFADVTIPAGPITADADGVIYGVGLEAMLANQISMRIEYIQSDLDVSGTGVPPNISVSGDTVSVGVAYHF